MDVALDALTSKLDALAPSAGRTRVVAVDGPSGSGKTSLAAELAERLGGVAVLHMDDLYPGWDGLQEAVPLLVGQVLEPLSEGRRAVYRRFDWVAGEYAEEHEVDPSPVLVVEGVGSGARACAPHLAAVVWVEAPLALRFARGIARDGEGYRPHWERWARQEDEHFALEGTRDRADVLVDTSQPGVWRLVDRTQEAAATAFGCRRGSSSAGGQRLS
ncbi:MAG: uridine kinase [Actinomycetes bacterium]